MADVNWHAARLIHEFRVKVALLFWANHRTFAFWCLVHLVLTRRWVLYWCRFWGVENICNANTAHVVEGSRHIHYQVFFVEFVVKTWHLGREKISQLLLIRVEVMRALEVGRGVLCGCVEGLVAGSTSGGSGGRLWPEGGLVNGATFIFSGVMIIGIFLTIHD